MSDFLNYIILGVLQGVFEWIPISSEGVVALGAQLLKTGANPVDLALYLHIGTLAAAFAFFWRDWLDLAAYKNKKLFRFLALTTAVSLALGFVLYHLIKETAFGSGLLILMGFGLLGTAYFNRKKISFSLGEDKLAVISGFLQGLAVIPGLSRSGSTIFGLSLAKNDPKEILKLSYLMSVPIVVASTGYFFFKDPEFTFNSWPAVVASFITGYLSLKIIFKASEKINFYRFALFFAFLCFLGAILEILA